MKKLWDWFINLSLPKIFLLAGSIITTLFIGMIAFTIAAAPYLPKSEKVAEKPTLKKTEKEKPKEKKTEEKLYLVTRVIDGDTIEIKGGKRVRYIGINTPETGQPFADEATNKNKELVEGKQVKLVKDVSETDKYGRLLRYVYVGEVFVNAELVKSGYANASTYPPDVAHADEFRELERQAREAQVGLWTPPPELPKAEEPPPQPAPVPAPQPIEQTVHITNTGKKYHSAGCRYLSQSDIVVSLSEAKARGLGP